MPRKYHPLQIPLAENYLLMNPLLPPAGFTASFFSSLWQQLLRLSDRLVAAAAERDKRSEAVPPNRDRRNEGQLGTGPNNKLLQRKQANRTQVEGETLIWMLIHHRNGVNQFQGVVSSIDFAFQDRSAEVGSDREDDLSN